MSEENLEKEQKDKNPVELDNSFLKYTTHAMSTVQHQRCYE